MTSALVAPSDIGLSRTAGFKLEPTLTATITTEFQLPPSCGIFSPQSIKYHAQNTSSHLLKRQLSAPLPTSNSIEDIKKIERNPPDTLGNHHVQQDTFRKPLGLSAFLKRRATLPTTLDPPKPEKQSLTFKPTVETTSTVTNFGVGNQNKNKFKNSEPSLFMSSLHLKDEESKSRMSLYLTNNRASSVDDRKRLFKSHKREQSFTVFEENRLPKNEPFHNGGVMECENNLPLRSFSMSSVSPASSSGDDVYETPPVTASGENNGIDNNNHDINSLSFTTTASNNDTTTTNNVAVTNSSSIEKSINTKSNNSKSKLKTKPKRIRTSFKVHQLIAMKELFDRDKNPDSGKLTTLSEQIDLPKRVLQVWFQNARAKSRKGLSVFSDNIEKLLLQSSKSTDKGGDEGGGVCIVVGSTLLEYERNEVHEADSCDNTTIDIAKLHENKKAICEESEKELTVKNIAWPRP